MKNGQNTRIKPHARQQAGQRIDGAKRALWIVAALILWMFAIIGRLAWLQVVKHDHYAGKAIQSQQRKGSVMAARGTISDRDGKELALTLLADSVFVDQKQFKNDEERRKAAGILSSLLGAGEPDLLKKLTGSDGFVWLQRKLDPEKSHALFNTLQEQKITGIAIRQEPQRLYPNESLAAHVVGFVGADDIGQAGLEQKFNDMLTGKPGQIRWDRDAAGRAYGRDELIPAEEGAHIQTTLDAVLQHKVEILLDEAMHMTHAKGASAIVLNPTNGEILAIANAPTFNPNERMKGHAGHGESKLRQNRTISWPYEPGSVFKIVAYSAALEEGLAKPDDMIHCGNGSITIGKRVINDTHSYGTLSIADAFAKSSNVGAIKLAQRVGKEKFHGYISRFGFGRKTGIELPGESRGIVHPLDAWRLDSIGSVAIGQEVSVTLLQAVAAMGAIANRGVWVQPHIVKQVASTGGRVLYDAKPETRQVIKPETATMMTALLERVVTHGTARAAIHLTGYSAAGKTGTPQKAIAGSGYKSGKYMPTFAGFVPANNPRFAIIVMIDEPQGAHHGGSVAAPVFNLIAEAALGDYAVPPDDKQFRELLAAISKRYESSAPDEPVHSTGQIEIQKAEPEIAQTVKSEPTPLPRASQQGRPGPTPAARNALVSTPPKKGALPVAQTTPPPLPLSEKETYLMPDFRGRGVRAVLQACAQLRLDARLYGSGVAIRQFPAAGVRIQSGEPCRVDFQ